MSLLESVKMALTKKRASARERYLDSLRKGRSAEQIAAAATEAGIADEQVEADAAILEKADALAAAAAEHPALKIKLDNATAKYGEIEGEYSKAVTSFAEQLNRAGEEVEKARVGEAPARKALKELSDLHRARGDILPPAPPAVRAILDQQDRETEIASSREAVRRARAAAGAIERELLVSRNERRSPGVTNRTMFQPATAAGVVGTLTQPTVPEDHAAFNAKQGEVVTLETKLSEATATAERLAVQHRKAFNEDVS